MSSLSRLLPALPGFTALGSTYAPWPVWSGSVANPVGFVPMAKKAAVRLWHRARDFDRGTHQAGHHGGGAVGHTGLPSALVQAALEGDPAGNALTPLERALASFQRSILARDS